VADLRTATVLDSEPAGPGFHALLAETPDALGALAGQWAAFHTQLPNPDKPGQTLRRAWSFAEIGERQFRLYVAVVGPCTRWLADRVPGDVLPFTGPWGSRFRLDDAPGPAGFFAAGSGISPVAAMVDACVAQGRSARLDWEIDVVPASMAARIAGWRAAGVGVRVAPSLAPEPGAATWWLAGDGARLDELEPLFSPPPERIERFYTPRPAGSP
jgi:hypothetical protein